LWILGTRGDPIKGLFLSRVAAVLKKDFRTYEV